MIEIGLDFNLDELLGLNTKIEDDFFGAKFGSRKEEIIECFKKHNIYLDEEDSREDELIFVKQESQDMKVENHLTFEGLNWEYILVNLLDNCLDKIMFNLTFDNKEEALNELDNVYSVISKKYNMKLTVEPNEYEINDDEPISIKAYGNCNGLIAFCSTEKNENNETLYNVTLCYCNLED